MKKFSKILSFSFILVLIFSSHAFAARSHIELAANQKWVEKSAIRSGDYSNVLSRLYAVYPKNGGQDNFTRIRVKVTSTSGTSMADIAILNETATSATKLTLKNGTLNQKVIIFEFSGNNPSYAAYADVSYDGR